MTPIKFKLWLSAILLATIFSTSCYSQLDLKFRWNLGVTTYSYFSEGFYMTARPNSYFNSLITAPTLGLDLYSPKLRLGLEQSYYAAFVPSSDSIFDLSYAKQSFTIGAYYLAFDRYKFSIFYSAQDHNILMTLPVLRGASISTRMGLGFALGYKLGKNTIELRKELMYEFRDGTRLPGMAGLTDHWTLRVLRDISFKEKAVNKGQSPYLFNIVLGLTASGNEVAKIARIANMKVFPTIGLETYRYKNIALYLRRSQWYHLDVRNGVNFKYTSQLNYLGVSYAYNTSSSGTFFLGLHHLWNATRGLQFISTFREGINNENLWFVYNNRGVGLDIRYRMKDSKFDFCLNTDYYYETRKEFPRGFNAESFRFGILYNL